MDTTELKYFCAAYENRSITKAADEVFISPQGLSRAIRKIEGELETTLFKRTNTGIEPTREGEELYRQARSIIDSLQNIKKNMSLETDQRTNLRVCMSLGLIDYLSTDFLQDFSDMHPEVNLITEMYADVKAEEVIRSGAADIGMVFGPIDMIQFEAVHFTSHHHCVLIPCSHPLAQKERISYMDLNDQPLAIMGQEFNVYQKALNRFACAGSHPRILIRAGEIETVNSFAENGKGIGFTVDFAALARPRINAVIKPLEDDGCRLESFIIRNRSGIKKSCRNAADVFEEFAFEWVRQHKDSLNNKELKG